jgi:Ser/Thr protein kinase RdoA (MazF antagonist)
MGRATDLHRERFDAFVAGYRERRSLPAEQVDLLPLFAAAGIADRLIGLRRALVMDASVGAESESLVGLRTRLAGVADLDRRSLLHAVW